MGHATISGKLDVGARGQTVGQTTDGILSYLPHDTGKYPRLDDRSKTFEKALLEENTCHASMQVVE